jgi:hypothetical protein
VSSKTAKVMGPIFVGGVLNATPSSFNRPDSFWTSSAKNAVAGIPCSKIAFWNVLAAGFSFGSKSSSMPSGPSSEATVRNLNYPIGMSLFFTKPKISV